MQISYKPGEGLIYRLNPLVKGAIAFTAILFFSINHLSIWHMVAILAGLLLPGLVAGVPMKDIFLSLRRVWILLLLVALIQGFREGGFVWLFAVEGILRILGVFIVAGLYVTVSSQSELMYFWETCFRPFALLGLPARELALIMVIAVRFLPVILGEIERIRMAQIARGAKLGNGGMIASAASLMPLMIPTLTQAIIRAGDLAQAMEARGYCLSARRTRYNLYKISVADFFLCLLPLFLLFLALK